MKVWLALVPIFLITHFSAFASPRLGDGDRDYEQRASETRARRALDTYRELHEANPEDPQIAWRVSMACYFVGLRLTPNSAEKKRIFAEGRDIGQAAIRKNSSCAPCYFWTAINMALYGQEVGAFKMLFSLKQIEAYLEKSIELDPKYASAGAYRLKGVIEEKLPGILGGSNSRARENFAKAIELAPDEPLNFLFMSELLENEFSDHDGAREFAKKGAKIGNLPSSRLESIEAKAELEKNLARLSSD